MLTKLQEAQAKYEEAKKLRDATFEALSLLEAKWRNPKNEASQLDNAAWHIQEQYLESLGMPRGFPTEAFMVALAAKVESTPEVISELRERANTSSFDNTLAQKIYDRARAAIPATINVKDAKERAAKLYILADQVEVEVRKSKEYMDLQALVNHQNRLVRIASEEVERCRKNEEARNRRQGQRTDPDLKAVKEAREKLNTILAGNPFTWTP